MASEHSGESNTTTNTNSLLAQSSIVYSTEDASVKTQPTSPAATENRASPTKERFKFDYGTDDDDQTNETIMKTPGPCKHSKTALGSLRYTLENRPPLHVLEMETTDADWQQCKSRKLRYRAIKEFLQRTGFNSERLMIINLDAKQTLRSPDTKGPVDHVIFPDVRSAGKITWRIGSIGRVTLKSTKISKRLPDGTLEHGPVSCHIRGDCHTLIKNADEFYDTCFNAMICGYATGDGYHLVQRPFLRPIPAEAIGDTGLTMEIHNYRISVRCRPVVRKESLHLHYDLVPSLPAGKPLSEILIEYFGKRILGSAITQHLPAIKGMLLGLRVSTNYENGKRTSAKTSGEGDPNGPPVPPSPTFGFGRRFNIADISMPSKVPSFCIDREVPNMEKGHKYSVAEYFEKVKQRKLEFPDLPLAKVGRDMWIPLEMLDVSGTGEIFHGSDSLTGAMQDLRSCFLRGNEGFSVEDWLKSIAKDFFSSMANQFPSTSALAKNLTLDAPTFVPAIPRKTNLEYQARREAIPRLFSLQKPEFSIGFLYISPSHARISPEETEFVEDIKRRLGEQQRFPCTIPAFVAITDVKELALETSWKNSQLSSLIKNPPLDALVAIVDEKKQTKASIKDIRAAVYKFGNRKLGSVTLCTSKKTLEDCIHANKTNKNYFPKNHIQKLNFMMGGRNLAEEGNTKPDEPLLKYGLSNMIIEAHISHAGSGAGSHCPSVAALVGSKKNSSSHYYGSARIQSRFQSTVWQEGNADRQVKYTVQSKIEGLRDMLKERFEQYLDDPPHVYFFRDNIAFDDNATVEECQEIEAAWKDRWPEASADEFALTYIVVNKNSELEPQTNAQRTGRVTPVTTFTTEEDSSKAKYKYYVMRNDSEVSAKRLRFFVQRLNNNHELGNPIAFTLPVHYARKLADRVFDCFHFYVADKFSLVSNVQRYLNNVGHEATHANGERAADLVKHYLVPGQWLRSQNAAQATPATSALPTSSVPEDNYPEDNGWNPWPKNLNETMFYL